MGNKGVQTKKEICLKAYELFASKGFQKVTMQDVCNVTGLSRGGLYRHFSNTSQIFEEIFLTLSGNSNSFFQDEMAKGRSSLEIWDEVKQKLQGEMLDSRNSLSLAIYEYSNLVDKTFFVELNKKGQKNWSAFFDYGIKRGEIGEFDVQQVVDLIAYSYQGIRMWGRVIPLSEQEVNHIIDSWETIIFKK